MKFVPTPLVVWLALAALASGWASASASSSNDDDDMVDHDANVAKTIPQYVEIPENAKGLTRFTHFIAINSTQTCLGDSHVRPFNNQIRGVNLGGWMVLEPWITPSLFYQFLGGNQSYAAFDMVRESKLQRAMRAVENSKLTLSVQYTFCELLGPEEANRQLRRHWETWVTEEIIAQLSDSGAVNSLRLPIGDFMYKPYGPYEGCVDGALEYVDTLLDWAYSNGLTVLLDIHALKDSQNGFDNSGQAMGFRWTSALNSDFSDIETFEHWPIRSARWMGEFDQETASYPKINHDNIQHALDVIQLIVERYSGHPAVLGLEPVNEPWQFTPIDELKKFYWDGYLIVKKGAPYWKYIMHDSFRLDPNVWGGFMDGCPDRALDTHIYQAWRDPDSRIGFYNDACATKKIIAQMEREFGPVIVGEWSLATDNCAMWLNGFNDNLPGFPRLPCKYIPCANPYMGKGQPGTPVDPTKALQGPYGTGLSGPIFGLCPVGRDWLKESSGNPQTGRDWVKAPPEATKHNDDTDNVMFHLANKKINAFSGVGHGFYFWNFRTDLYEPEWSYMLAMERGWIPKGNLNEEKIQSACEREDDGDFKCILKRNVEDVYVRHAVRYILDVDNQTATDFGQKILSLQGEDLNRQASSLIGEYFDDHKAAGATCDFGGVAMLVETNRNITDDDSVAATDDEYFGGTITIYQGPGTIALVLIVLGATMIGSILGFVFAMRTSKKFNKHVRESKFFRPISQTSLRMVRSSLALPEQESYGELSGLMGRHGKPRT